MLLDYLGKNINGKRLYTEVCDDNEERLHSKKKKILAFKIALNICNSANEVCDYLDAFDEFSGIENDLMTHDYETLKRLCIDLYTDKTDGSWWYDIYIKGRLARYKWYEYENEYVVSIVETNDEITTRYIRIQED